MTGTDGESTANCLERNSRSELYYIQAKTTIEKYVAAMDEPYARKLESILADFASSTRLIEAKKMKVSVLTDYFARK